MLAAEVAYCKDVMFIIALINLYLGMDNHRLDRTAFKAQTAEEAIKNQALYYKQLTWQERLIIANYLNSVAYNYPENEPPRLDRTLFSIRRHK